MFKKEKTPDVHNFEMVMCASKRLIRNKNIFTENLVLNILHEVQITSFFLTSVQITYIYVLIM